MKALVLGGTRFIGRRLVEALLKRGHRVTILTRGRRLDPWGSRVSRLVGDRRSPKDLARAAPGGKDAVFDMLSYRAEDASLAVDAFSGRTAHFVQISTCSVYWCTGDFPCPVFEEEFERFGEFDENPGSIEYAYGYGKRRAEEVLFEAHRSTGFPVTTIRMPIVAGEADPSGRYLAYLRRIEDGQPLILPDAGTTPFRHVYVADVAESLADLPGKSHAIGRAYNLACAEILDLRRVVIMVAEMLGRSVTTVPIPLQLLDARGLDRSFSPFTQAAGQVPAIRRARLELEWDPTPYAVWLERTVRWYRDYYRAGDPPGYEHRRRELEILRAYLEETRLRAPTDTRAARPGTE